MKSQGKNKNYLAYSLIGHAVILLGLILGLDFSSALPVFENTNKQDVISAVVLGDTAKSKIIPQKPVPDIKPQIKEEPKEDVAAVKTPAKKIEPIETKKDEIALNKAEKKKDDKKKLALMKALEEKKLRDKLAKDLLSDIEKVSDKKKKQKQKQLSSQFEKMLKEQAEKSLRQDLLNEEIKLEGKQSRQSQGEVNKYKALILQAISEHWIVPSQANKKLYCELMIRVAPGGMVLDVQVTKTSGDPSLDSSARAAVLKSSPLPVPKDSGAFEPFRQFVLKVKPENIV
jgi:colicin import membrane protein